MKPVTLCYLGLGGNLGQPLTLFDEVVRYFDQHPDVSQSRESARYQSAPVDATGPDYVNSVLEIRWHGTPDQLLQACMGLEHQLGRVRTTRNAPRLIDVDVLLFGQNIICTGTLTVPHPRMHLRRFVLEPLLALQPLIEIPGLGPARNYLPLVGDQALKPV